MMKLCIMIQLLIIDYIHAYTNQALSRLCALQSLVCKACVVTTLVYLHICISEHIQLMLTRKPIRDCGMMNDLSCSHELTIA
jgi:hypothetical protein